MEYTKIEETRIYLMDKYGYPTEQKFGNMTYKTINQELEIFNRLITALCKSAEKTDLGNIEKQVNLICEFAKDLDPINLDKIATRLEKLYRDLNKNVNFSKKPFIKMMEELSAAADKKDFEINKVIYYFAEHLKISPVSFNVKGGRKGKYEDLDGSYWRRNKGLEDNNI